MGVVHAKTIITMPSAGNIPDDEVIVDLEAVPAKVEAIHIDGVVRTKDGIIRKHVADILTAQNFEDMIEKSERARIILEGMGIFKEVSFVIDTSKGENADKHGYQVIFDVTELGRVSGGVSTMVGTNEGSILFNVKLPNTFGRAEKINADYTYGTKNAVGFGLNFSKPLQGNPEVIDRSRIMWFNLGAMQFSSDYQWSGYKETDRGLMASLSFPTLLGGHQISWEAMWREVGCLNSSTPFAVREQSGHSLKSSLKHTFTRDTRDSTVLPSEGYLLKTTHEVAGIGGDVNFLKKDGEVQINIPTLFDSVLQFSLAGGIMKPIRPGSRIMLPDRFYLGGPLTLRGFNLRGAGPSVEGCAMGADSYWLAAAHLYTPLPFRPGKGGFGDLFRTHFFINGGNLANIDFADHWKANLARMAETLRWTYGGGIVFRFGAIARLELNYCIPMKVQRGDSSVDGVQFGIGVSFL